MPDDGLIFVCSGCCCGQPGPGGALAPPRVLRATARRLHQASGLAGRVRLAVTDCLGPCSEANVMLLYLRGRALWLRRMNAPALLEALFAYAREAAGGDPSPLPTELAARTFSWAGGGVGPEPPIPEGDRPGAPA